MIKTVDGKLTVKCSDVKDAESVEELARKIQSAIMRAMGWENYDGKIVIDLIVEPNPEKLYVTYTIERGFSRGYKITVAELIETLS